MRQQRTFWVGVLFFGLLAPLSAMLASGASAATCVEHGTRLNPITHQLEYYCVRYSDETNPGDPGDPGTDQPTCDLVSPATYCQGTTPCYVKDNVVPFVEPKGPPPKPGADWHVVMCLQGGAWNGTAVWDDEAPQPPSLQQQAQTAFGNLRPPKTSLSFNPPGFTVVNIATWFWADGLTQQKLTGSSAFGLVAVAEPDRLEVTPGDGTAQNCPWATQKSDECNYVYTRASAASGAAEVDGHAAYAAHAQAFWSVHFEQGGRRIIIPGAPTELPGPAMNSAVVVREIQSLVTSTR